MPTNSAALLHGARGALRSHVPLALWMVAGPGCVVYTDDIEAPPPPVVVEEEVVVEVVYNLPPMLLDAYAWVSWDPYQRDDVWQFEAVVDDPDGPYDVVQVWADVYDDWTGQLLESVPLYPTADPYVWSAAYLGRTLWLDPTYPYLSVDFVAYDSLDQVDWVTVWADTY